jgi:hypothetical protein
MKGFTKFLAAAIVLAVWCAVSPAQGVTEAQGADKISEQAPPDTLRVWRSIISFKGSGINYSYGSRSGDVGSTGEGIKRVLKDDSLALREACAFGRHRVWGYAASICCGACLGWGYSQQWNEDGADPQPFYLAGAGFLLLNVAISETGYRHLKKAVRIFNGNRRSAGGGA